ncbi:hypothetical protein RvY_04212-3 [Ramazzottius varieornatus]|nr:hypothetical protein RvY_04212-3 [Ramazzottius varieornatus]
MVMESFEPNLARGPYYPPRAPLLTKEDILTKPISDPDKLVHALNRLKMLVVERRMHLEQIFRVFDPHSIRYVQNVRTVSRILQLATLQVSPEECDLIIERFSDAKGFRYLEFLQAIDTQSYGQSLPTYPITVATMERWKNKRAWYPEVTPQNAYQNYQGPEAVVEKCRRKVSIDRLRVSDFFVDYDTHHRGVITRKQFRRCTTMMGFQLSPMENLILENQ